MHTLEVRDKNNNLIYTRTAADPPASGPEPSYVGHEFYRVKGMLKLCCEQQNRDYPTDPYYLKDATMGQILYGSHCPVCGGALPV